MLATPVVTTTPIYAARLYARPASGSDPQPTLPPDRPDKQAERNRLLRVEAAEGADPGGGSRRLDGSSDGTDTGSKARATGPMARSDTEDRGAAQLPGPGRLSEGERALVEELAARDREVRRHEAAHVRVGGQYAGRPEFYFVTGPDGRRYATGGEVAIDVAPEREPVETIEKMEIVKAAALAPAEPSPADRRVAALADTLRRAAELELVIGPGQVLAAAAALAAGEDRRLSDLSAAYSRLEPIPAPEVVRSA